MRFLKDNHKPIFLLLLIAFIFAAALSITRSASDDEVYYLNDSLQISECFKQLKWIGNQPVGFHGFLFKLPAALLFMVTGPSVFAATLINIIPAILALYLSYLIFAPILESRKWALYTSFLFFGSVFFLRMLATFKRDGVIVFCLLLFIYLNIKRKNKWLIGLSLLLVLDAKESVFFMILPGYVLWVIHNEYLRNKESRGYTFLIPVLSRLFAGFFPSFVFLFLMVTTVVIPLNPAVTKILGLNYGGLASAVGPFKPTAATRNTLEGGKTIFQLPTFNNYGWKAADAGEVVMLPKTFTPPAAAAGKDFPIVKLIKPREKSGHESGGYYHYCRPHPNPVPYKQGDIIVYSLWYKTKSANAADLMAVNNFPGIIGNAGEKKIELQKDSRWHFVKTEVPVIRAGQIQPELRWSYGRDMVLYAAACKIEKKAGGNEAVKSKTAKIKPAPGKETAKETPRQPHESAGNSSPFLYLKNKLFSIINFILLYLGKIFFSRTFSFTTMPRFIILPAFVMSFRLYRLWKHNREYKKLILPFIFWFYLFVYLLRASFGRYMLPIVPIVLLFFILFLEHGLKEKTFARNTLIAVVVFAAAGLYFETNYPIIKLFLTLLFVAGLWFLFYLRHRQNPSQIAEKVKVVYICLIGVFSIAVFLGTSYAEPGQIGRYLTWGYNSEMRKIAHYFDKDQTIWINHNHGLVQFYRNDPTYSILSSKSIIWELQEWVPKAAMVNKMTQLDTYSFEWESADRLKAEVLKRNITKVALVVSTVKKPKFTFPMQERLPDLEKMSFLIRQKKIDMKNKVLYIFKVNL